MTIRMYNSFCTKVSRKKMAQGVNFFQNFWVQFSDVRKFYFGAGVYPEQIKSVAQIKTADLQRTTTKRHSLNALFSDPPSSLTINQTGTHFGSY